MQTWTLRRTELADAQELVRLRGLMLQALGQDSGLADAAWRAAARDWFAERLARRRDRFVAYVIGGKPGERLLACGLAWLDERVPSPTCPNGLRGHITGMYTEPHARGRGHGRAILGELLGWLQRQGMVVAELHASAQGAPLYRSAGFQLIDYPAMSLRLNPIIQPQL
jgi:GNAT superfamily N-acetyltransferase